MLSYSTATWHTKTPKINLLPFLLQRKTLLGEGSTENTKASAALQHGHWFSPQDVILVNLQMLAQAKNRP